MKKVGRVAVNQIAGKEALEVIDTLASNFAEGNDDVANAVDSLKNAFQECVNNTIAREGKDRVVVFIDDLDRLNPVKAIELLEVLKIFLDCEHCVFVLAIDYAVVSSGVKQKYGDLIGTDKGKQFFDKIIQVPFKMPVAHYQVRRYVIEMFKQAEITFRSEKEADIYVDLIQHSVGCNPRTMKRLFNAFLLLMCIGENVNFSARIEDPVEGPWYRKMLFAILCCQHAYEDLYNFLIRNKSEILKPDVLEELQNPESYRPVESDSGSDKKTDDITKDELVQELQDKFKNAPEDLISRMAEFMELFVEVIDKSGDNTLDEDEELAALEEIFSISSITMTGNEETVERRTARGSRIISDVESLEMGSMTNEKKIEMAEFLRNLGEDVEVLYVQGKFSHIAAKTNYGQGTTFADIYGLKKGYRIDIYAPKAGLLFGWKKMPEVGEWVKAHDLTPKKNSSHKNKVSPKIFTAAEEASVKEFIEMIYVAWGKFGK